MTERVQPRIDTDWNGEYLDLHIEAIGVISMRRHGDRIHLAIVGPDVARLTAAEADDVACALASAAAIVRGLGAPSGGPTGGTPNA